MSKVLLHNLTMPYSRCHPGIFNFDQNSIFFARAGDIVVTRSPVSARYIAFLEKMGHNMANIEFVSSDNPLRGPVAVFEDPELAEKVRSAIRKCGGQWTLDSYMLTDWESRWAEALGIAVDGDSLCYNEFSGKSAFRTIAKQYKFPVPAGFEGKSKTLDIAVGAAKLFLKGFREVVIKQDYGAAGLGSVRITYAQFVSGLHRFSSLLPRNFEWSEAFRHSGDFVIEGWQRDVMFSPSAQLYIHANGFPELISSHVQLFFENKMTYRGCLSYHWIPDSVLTEFHKEALRFVGALAAAGLRGHIAFNAIVLSDGRILWTEINPRRVSSSYPSQIVKILKAANTKSDHCYISYRVRKKKWERFSVERLLETIEPLCFSAASGKGVIPYDFGGLYDLGELYILSIAPRRDEAEAILQHVLSI